MTAAANKVGLAGADSARLLVEEESPPPSFAHFIAADNEQAVTTLKNPSGVLHLWGESGAGKTHLLRAAAAALAARGCNAKFCRAAQTPSPPVLDAGDSDVGGVKNKTAHEKNAPKYALAVDDVEALTDAPECAQNLFNWQNLAWRRSDVVVLSSSTKPPVELNLRADVRTRLGGGLLFQILPLASEHLEAALCAHARRLDINLPDEAREMLLRYLPRAISPLVDALAALDRHLLKQRGKPDRQAVSRWLKEEGFL